MKDDKQLLKDLLLEYKELVLKINRLNRFMTTYFMDLEVIEIEQLDTQLCYMNGYRDSLFCRINDTRRKFNI